MPWKEKLCSQPMAGKQAPTYLEKANQAARALAEASGGIPQSIALESIGKSLTAHILGGACIGATEAEGVVDSTIVCLLTGYLYCRRFCNSCQHRVLTQA